jgi:hypothetical protein
VRGKLRWLFRRRLCFGGLAGALVFFCYSLTPSLLPRGDVLQGVLSGITVVIGYGVGSALSAGIRKLRSTEPSRGFKRIAWWVLLGATVVLVPLFLLLGGSWQNDVRDLMGMSEEPVGLDRDPDPDRRLLGGPALDRVSCGFAGSWSVDRPVRPRAVSVPAGGRVDGRRRDQRDQGFLLDPALGATPVLRRQHGNGTGRQPADAARTQR